MIKNNRKEFTGVDKIKFIMAAIVVAAHTHPFEGIDNNSAMFKVWEAVVQLAVPYFFIASGYFLFLKLTKNPDKIIQLQHLKSYGKRIAFLYISWTIIYLPITIWKFFNNDLYYTTDFLLFLRGFFLLGENYYSWPLWYLLSMIYSLGIIYILKKLSLGIKAIFFISLTIFCFSILINYVGMAEIWNEELSKFRVAVTSSFGTGRLFSGVLYIIIGAFFAKQQPRLTVVMIVFIYTVAIMLQIWRIPFLSELLFVLFPAAIFIASLNFGDGKVQIAYFFRKCSTVMFFTHMIVFFLYTLLFKQFRYFGLDAFLVSFTIPILLTPLIIKLEHRNPHFKAHILTPHGSLIREL